MATKKAGTLQIYDDAIHRLFVEGVMPLDVEKRQTLETAGVPGVKSLRLYEIILATAMCMIIGEWQKREAIIALISLAGDASP